MHTENVDTRRRLFGHRKPVPVGAERHRAWPHSRTAEVTNGSFDLAKTSPVEPKADDAARASRIENVDQLAVLSDRDGLCSAGGRFVGEDEARAIDGECTDCSAAGIHCEQPIVIGAEPE